MQNIGKCTKCTECTICESVRSVQSVQSAEVYEVYRVYKGINKDSNIYCVLENDVEIEIMVKEINPYMPAYPVMPENFAGRDQILESLKEALEYTTHARAINVAIVGEWGIGKTALLIKAQEISKKEYESISFIVDVQSGQTSESTLNAIIQKLLHEIQREYPSLTLSGGGVKDVGRIQLDRAIQQIKDGSSDSPTLFESNLLSLWGAVADKNRIILIMVDNLEFLEREELIKIVETIRNVFQALPRSGCKIMVILSGKQIFYDTSAKLYSPTTRFFQRIALEKFSEEESLEAIALPLREASGFDFSKEAKVELHRLSEGHPYILKSLCFLIFKLQNGKGKVSKKSLEKLLPSLVKGLGEDVFGSMLERASVEEKKILFALAKSKDDILSFSEIKSLANMSKRGTHLSRLVEKELVIRSSRGQYALFHPLFKEFLRLIVD